MSARRVGRRVGNALAVGALVALVVLDLVDVPVRLWFYHRAVTASAVIGLLVLLITVLGVDEVVRLRSLRDRARVIGAQAAIVSAQAQRATEQVRAELADPGSREGAADELRTYMTMLLVSAPVLIEAPPSRAFLEDAQRLAAQLAVAVNHPDQAATGRRRAIDAAVDAVRASAGPLLAALNRPELAAVDGDPEAAEAPGG